MRISDWSSDVCSSDLSLVRRHHTVLAAISSCYSVPEGRFPRVTHPCATKPEGFVRLACVRHAASVRSEPGSNSQVNVQSPGQGKPAQQPSSRSHLSDQRTSRSTGITQQDRKNVVYGKGVEERVDPG